MKSCNPVCLMFMLFTCIPFSYAQVWQQYSDSAKVLREQGKMYQAIELYGKANEELNKDSLGTKTYAITCNDLANLYWNTEQYQKAEPLYLQAKQIQEKLVGKQHPDYAKSCHNLALLYWQTGLYEKSEPLYLEAKQIREKLLGKQHPDYILTCNNLGVLYWTSGRFEKAEPLLLEAKQTVGEVQGKEHPFYIYTCNNLGLLYQDMGQYDKAALLFLEAKQIQGKSSGEENPEYASFCSNLATVYQDMRQYEKAEALYLQSKQIREKLLGKQHADYAQSCNNLASLYQDMGQYARAEPLYLQAKQVREKLVGKQHPDYARSCHYLALLYQDMAQYEKARPLYMEAKRIRLKALGKQHPDYGACCEDLATLYWLLYQPFQAEKEFREAFSVKAANLLSVFQFTNEKEKAAYIQNVSGEDDKAYSFYLSEQIKSAQPYSLSLFHRNLILSSSEAVKKQLLTANDPAVLNKYRDWINIKKHLSTLYSQPVEERKEDAGALEAKAGLQEKELTRLSAAFAQQRQKADWKDIQNKLKAGEASIEFASFHLSTARRHTDTVIYVAMLLRKDVPLPAMVFLFTEKQLTGLLSAAAGESSTESVQKLYGSTKVAVNDRKRTAKSIYELIWKPLEKKLSGVKTIYFAPAGMLHRIAFAALPVNGKEVLSDRYKLVQLATTASLVDQQPAYVTASDKIQLYGDISYSADAAALRGVALPSHHENMVSRSLPDDLIRGGGWNELPGTKKEIDEIISLADKVQTNIISLSGLNATEESLKALDGKASPAVLHIATHGFFFPDPKTGAGNDKNSDKGKVFKSSDDPLMRAGLLFAGANNAWQNTPVEGIDDGILTAYEVSNLYLSDTKLAVLSGCETGLGEIHGSEGVYGLQRACKMAGVNNIVMSLWKVPDLETAEFMKAFYKNLFARQTISNAFYNAQEFMKSKYRLKPYKWAAWVLVR